MAGKALLFPGRIFEKGIWREGLQAFSGRRDDLSEPGWNLRDARLYFLQ